MSGGIGYNAMAVTENDLRMSHDRIQMWIASLKGEMMDIMNRDLGSHRKLTQLEPQFADATRSYNNLQKQYDELLQAFEELKTQPRNNIEPHRTVVLIDGDGALFNFDLIEQGQAGGGRAAAKIMESIKDYMDAGRRDEIWVYVFLNKKGLKALFQRHNRPVASYELDDFVIGMNEAAKTIMVVDVGQKKEAADSKIKVLLDSEVRSLETRKVFFAGSHDNGYVTELRAQVTSGYKEKLVLVPSYTEVASGYKELELATLSIPDLFMSEKLPYAPQTPRPASLTLNERPESGAGKATAQVPEFPPGLPVVEAWSTMPSRNRAASSSRTAELSDRRNASPGDDDRDSTGSGAAATSPHLTNKGRRHINPALPLSKQKPPPCTLFYLADACKHESTCKYGHNYILNDENYEEMRLNARKTPCQATNAGMICTWGENCCYGHKCPFAPSCHFFKLGKCKFEQKDMHRVSK